MRDEQFGGGDACPARCPPNDQNAIIPGQHKCLMAFACGGQRGAGCGERIGCGVENFYRRQIYGAIVARAGSADYCDVSVEQRGCRLRIARGRKIRAGADAAGSGIKNVGRSQRVGSIESAHNKDAAILQHSHSMLGARG